MPGEFSLTSFAAFTVGMGATLDKVQRECLEDGAKILEKESKRVLGTYDYGWEELHDATKEDRTAQGYSANEPGLRSGDMRDSIGHTVVSNKEAQIGSDEDKMVYFDIGTKTQEPRPVFERAGIAKEKEIGDAFGKRAHAAMTSNNASIKGYLP